MPLLYVYIPYITHLICIYWTRYHLLHLAYAVLYHHSFIYFFIYIFLFIPLHLCVYKVVVKLLDITALLELEAQAFRYTRINIC